MCIFLSEVLAPFNLLDKNIGIDQESFFEPEFIERDEILCKPYKTLWKGLINKDESIKHGKIYKHKINNMEELSAVQQKYHLNLTEVICQRPPLIALEHHIQLITMEIDECLSNPDFRKKLPHKGLAYLVYLAFRLNVTYGQKVSRANEIWELAKDNLEHFKEFNQCIELFFFMVMNDIEDHSASSRFAFYEEFYVNYIGSGSGNLISIGNDWYEYRLALCVGKILKYKKKLGQEVREEIKSFFNATCENFRDRINANDGAIYALRLVRLLDSAELFTLLEWKSMNKYLSSDDSSKVSMLYKTVADIFVLSDDKAAVKESFHLYRMLFKSKFVTGTLLHNLATLYLLEKEMPWRERFYEALNCWRIAYIHGFRDPRMQRSFASILRENGDPVFAQIVLRGGALPKRMFKNKELYIEDIKQEWELEYDVE
ncbi:MAG: hypothetical protein HQK84_11135 [Nitrospinae bacterium]|nr:hypothetical protein [Nitrospinota bacterium]